MRYYSTRGLSEAVDCAHAVIKGLADDGGLYMMDRIPQINVAECLGKDTMGMAAQILGAILPDFPDMNDLVQRAYTGKFETDELTPENIERIVTRSLMIKKEVVEKDEKESGLRKILNFGHTLGHGIEAEEGLSGLYHGECVALGMIPMCDKSVRERLIPVLKKLDLPTKYNGDIEKALSYVGHDKKCAGDSLDAIFVDSIGSFRIERMTLDGFSSLVKERI